MCIDLPSVQGSNGQLAFFLDRGGVCERENEKKEGKRMEGEVSVSVCC
jgi:hypothetical protein